MKLYITPGSPYARMARVMGLEKGRGERVEIVPAQTRQADSPYYKINPSGRVPYLIRDDGVGLEESAVICAHLDHVEGNLIFDLPVGEQAWEARRLEALARSMLDGLACGAARSRVLKTSSHQQLSGTRQIAVNEWPICGSGKSTIR